MTPGVAIILLGSSGYDPNEGGYAAGFGRFLIVAAGLATMLIGAVTGGIIGASYDADYVLYSGPVGRYVHPP